MLKKKKKERKLGYLFPSYLLYPLSKLLSNSSFLSFFSINLSIVKDCPGSSFLLLLVIVVVIVVVKEDEKGEEEGERKKYMERFSRGVNHSTEKRSRTR